jgi:hypothetical protein
MYDNIEFPFHVRTSLISGTAEVEGALSGHPDVAEAAVIGYVQSSWVMPHLAHYHLACAASFSK